MGFFMDLLLGDVGRIRLLGDVVIGNDCVLRQGHSNFGDLLHQICTDPLPFFLDGVIRAEADGFSKINFLKIRCQIHGNEGHFFFGPLIVQLRHIDELILKLANDMVMRHTVLREDDHMVAFLQPLNGLFESGNDSGIMVNADGIGVVKNAYRKRCNNVRQELIKPPDIFWLFGPEILVGVGWHILQVHHFSGAPDIMTARRVKLACNGSVHLAMVAHNDRCFFWYILLTFYTDLGIEGFYKPFDHFI